MDNMIFSDETGVGIGGPVITQRTLNSINIEQARDINKGNLLELGGPEGLAEKLGVSLKCGLDQEQVSTTIRTPSLSEFLLRLPYYFKNRLKKCAKDSVETNFLNLL